MKSNKCNRIIQLRSDTSHYMVFEQVFSLGIYDIELEFTPNVIVDCGTNIGFSSIHFANKYPNAKIITIEPERSNYNMLRRNIYDYHNIICINKGLWFKSCFLEIIDTNVFNWDLWLKNLQKEQIFVLSR